MASPMWNKDTPACLLINQETGSLTAKAPMIPCIMTNIPASKSPWKKVKYAMIILTAKEEITLKILPTKLYATINTVPIEQIFNPNDITNTRSS